MFSERLYQEVASQLNCEVAAIKAVARVESAGRGFTTGNRLMCLFEGHVFYEKTGGKFAKSNPTLCYPKWVTKYYKSSYDDEYVERFSAAFRLDADAAMQSCSWGAFQIMGFHYKMLDFDSPGSMIDYLKADIDNHLRLFAKFLLHKEKRNLLMALQAKQWGTFAYFYNGQSYKKNLYDSKLKAAYTKYANNQY